MKRRQFLGVAAMALTAGTTTNLRGLERLASEQKRTDKMPVLFVGHGSPMNAIEDNRFSAEWERVGRELPHPEAILSISAHWLTHGTKVTAMEKPKTIHDFGGFPQALFDVEYPAPGAPQLAREISRESEQHKPSQSGVPARHIMLDDDWGFDHGTWSVLKRMYPNAEIPVLQLSLDYRMPAEEHFALGQSLASLRRKGILIVGSGNVVHNLRALRFNDDAEKFAWAEEFDTWVAKHIEENREHELTEFQKLGDLARLAHPTYDHYLPLLYTGALRETSDRLRFFNTGIEYGSLSMRSVIYE